MNAWPLVSVLLGWGGWLLLLRRFAPWLKLQPAAPVGTHPARVSVILPCRNEAANLPGCLASLVKTAPGLNLEILIVDDESDDGSPALAAQLALQPGREEVRMRVLQAGPRPPGWVGKTWACHQGAAAATGDFLLFTDADTRHLPGSLTRALAALGPETAMLSALPYHRGHSRWEGLMGPFHLLALAVTAPFAPPRPRRLFAIGQYLLFRADAYRTLGGHAAVKDCLAEDLQLARRCLLQGQKYLVSRERLFEVSMFKSFPAFVSGWRRLCALGLEFGHPAAALEVALIMTAFCGGGHPGSPAGQLLMLCTLGLCLWLQRRLGNFSAWGVLLFPLSLTVFCLTTVLGVFDARLRRRIVWRGRSYTLSGAPPFKTQSRITSTSSSKGYSP